MSSSSVPASSTSHRGSAPFPDLSRNGSIPWLIGSFLILATSWALLWSGQSYWNPVLFFGLWTGATLLVRTLQGEPTLPLPRHGALMLLSIPAWWWFEFVNGWVQNWRYHGTVQYNLWEYSLFASLAFSTVVPALEAAWHLSLRWVRSMHFPRVGARPAWCVLEVLSGVATQAFIFLLPVYFYPFVWVAPFLILDGVVGLMGGPNLAREMSRGRWRLALAIGLAGVGCGLLWELWNFWANPKWTYNIPFVHFFQIFEMPLPGYLGYIPFAWSIFQLVQLAERCWHSLVHRPTSDSCSLISLKVSATGSQTSAWVAPPAGP